MKKIIIGLALLAIFVLPVVVAAETTQTSCKLKRNVEVDGVTYSSGITVDDPGAVAATCGSTGTLTTSCTTPTWGMICLLNTLNSLIDWVFTALVILAVFFTILGAWTMVTASGNAENMTKGKDFILYAAIGLAVAFLARALPGIVKSIAGF